MPLADTAADGDRLATLRELRDRLACDLDVCGSARDVASLSQRLMDVLTQIDELTGGTATTTTKTKKATGLDEFTQRLQDRDVPAKTARRTRRQA